MEPAVANPRTHPRSDLVLGAVLAAAGPSARLAQFAHANGSEIARPGTVVRVALAAAVLAALVVVVTCRGGRRSPLRVGAAVAVVGALWFGADVLGSGTIGRPLAWVVVAGLSGVAAADLAERRWVAVAALAALVTATVGFTAVARSDRRALQEAAAATVDDAADAGDRPVAADVADQPNVYLFVVDAFERPDEIATQLGGNLDGFVASLESKGFVVDPRATTNYIETMLSLPSLLDQRYHATPESAPGTLRGTDRRSVVSGRNRTVAALEARGYRYVQATPGLTDQIACDSDVADVCLEAEAGEALVRVDEVGRALVDLTPLGPLLRRTSSHAGAIATPESVLDGLDAERASLRGRPFFLYAHLLLPHPPFRFAGDCTPWPAPIGEIGETWPRSHISAYVEQARCTASMLEELADRLQRDDPDAIVVIVGDHGSSFDVPPGPLSWWTPDNLYQRFSVLRAEKLPDRCRTDDPRASSSVNTFRVVVACIDGVAPDLLEPRAFVTTYGETRIEEIPEAVLEPR